MKTISLTCDKKNYPKLSEVCLSCSMYYECVVKGNKVLVAAIVDNTTTMSAEIQEKEMPPIPCSITLNTNCSTIPVDSHIMDNVLDSLSIIHKINKNIL